MNNTIWLQWFRLVVLIGIIGVLLCAVAWLSRVAAWVIGEIIRKP